MPACLGLGSRKQPPILCIISAFQFGSVSLKEATEVLYLCCVHLAKADGWGQTLMNRMHHISSIRVPQHCERHNTAGPAQLWIRKNPPTILLYKAPLQHWSTVLRTFGRRGEADGSYRYRIGTLDEPDPAGCKRVYQTKATRIPSATFVRNFRSKAPYLFRDLGNSSSS
jgi:hypothetical protein